MSRNLLIDEPPLQVLPTLAKLVGLNESIFLQQLHWLLGKIGKTRDGRRWVYRTYEEWVTDFPFWSERTIMRIVSNLETRNLLTTTDRYNKINSDRTLWYAIDYQGLDRLSGPPDKVSPSRVTICHPLLGDDKVSPSNHRREGKEGDRSSPPDSENEGNQDWEKVRSAHERWIGLLVPSAIETLKAALDQYPAAWLVEALELTQQRYVEGKCQKPNLVYALGICRNWQDNGYDGQREDPEAVKDQVDAALARIGL